MNGESPKKGSVMYQICKVHAEYFYLQQEAFLKAIQDTEIRVEISL